MRMKRWLSLALGIAGLITSAFSYAEFTRVEENAASVSYTGAWTTHYGASVSGGSVVASSEVGASSTITFNGTGIQWISYQCQCATGPANVYLDGILRTTTTPLPGWVDTEPKSVKYRISGLAPGTHTLRIEVIDYVPGWAGRTPGAIVVDAFLVETAVMTRQLEENDTAITYTGDWTDIDDTSVSGGSVLATDQVGATATVRFNGTGIAWVGYRCPCTGFAQLGWDDRGPFPVGTYYETREPQAVIYHVKGLANGEHQLRIEAAGSSDGGPWLVVDAFRVFGPEAPDTTPPEITIRSPAQGQTVHGVVNIITDAFDGQALNDFPFSVAQSFYIDGVQVQIPRPGANPLFNWWYTTEFSDGPHTLVVVARDAAGNETRSAPVTVVVDNATDRTVPQVTMTAPAHSSNVTGTVSLAANATDNVGVMRVEFYYNTGDGNEVLLDSDSTAPFAITRDTTGIPSGRSFVLHARAYDAAGNVGRSNSVTVTVQH